ncbi:hypothetical protein JEY73_15595, partial [Pseudomonas aeruginosa]|nr:hypothetical protein [Pseudomonas aeruginosa]
TLPTYGRQRQLCKRDRARGALATALLWGAAAGVAAAAGAIEAESASFAIDKIDQSIAKYSETLASRGGKDTQS